MPAAKSDSAPVNLQERDLALFRSLFESRVMTAAHAAVLHFDGKKEATKKRLQRLKAAGFIAERRRKAYEPSVLFLTRKAFSLLREQGILADYPRLALPTLEKRARVSDLTIRHELEVMDVKAAFHSAIRWTKRFTVAEFSTWPLLYEFQAIRIGYGGAEVTVKPDGFIRIHEQEKDGGLSEHTFFLEVDRSTETQNTLVSRAGCYLDYYKSGGFAVRNGAPRSAFKEFPFRVLMVFKTAERRNNTAERLLQQNPPILTQVCLATLDEVTTNPLGAIWIRPKDYKDAMPSCQSSPSANAPYRRQRERDLAIDKSVVPFSLLN
jgi:hypothetical protein